MDGEREEQKSIDDLPVEMLEKVFLALDAKSLKNCCLVNKKWSNVIGQSSLVMEKLPLRLHENYKTTSWSDIYHSTKNFERKFHTIAINQLDVSDEDAIKTLHKFGAECRRIQFSGCSFINEISMESLKFPLLESAEMVDADGEFASQILKVISSSQLKYLSYDGRSGFSEVMTFLSTQTKLTKLELQLEQRSLSNGCLSDIKRIQIPLKTLSLSIHNTAENQENLVTFLSRFTETLEDLTLSLYNICGSALELIFTKLSKLKSLSIRINSAPREISFYHKFRPNNSVKKLVVQGFGSNNKETFDRFIELLPNVETLVLNLLRIPIDALLFVSNHLKRLTTLELDNVTSLDMVKLARAHLPSVRTIVFGKIDVGHEQWKLIVDALPNIESMSIKFFHYLESLSIRSIEIIAKNWPNLIHLKFGDGFVAKDRIFIELLRNCKNIKTIEFPKSAFKSQKSKTKILESVKKHGLRLIISDKRRKKSTIIISYD